MGRLGIIVGFIIGLILDILYVVPGLKEAEPTGYLLVVLLTPIAFAWLGNYIEENM